MFSYILKRLFLAIISLFVVITIVFFMMKAIPGVPLERANLQSEENFQQQLKNLGLLDPIGVQYFKYIGGLFVGNFGVNYNNIGTPIPTTVFRVMPYTLVIMGLVYIISLVLGIFMGVLTSYYKGRVFDNVIIFIVTLLQSVPLFVLMPVLVWILSNSDIQTRFYALDSAGFSLQKLLNAFWPILLLVLTYSPAYIIFLRNELNEQLNLSYVKVAVGKGNSKWAVVFKHVLRNSIIPLLYVIVPGFILIISGSVMSEIFFGIPGFASLLVNSVTTRQYNLVLFQTLFFSGIYYVLSILVDILVTFVDPRIKLFGNNANSIFTQIKFAFIRFIRTQRWLNVLNQNNYLQLTNDAPLMQFVRENELIRNNKIYLKQASLSDFDLPVNLKYLFTNNMLYRIVIDKK